MLAAPIPINDAERLAMLRSLLILDTANDDSFDNIVTVCAARFGVPTALVSLVDANRQWFKARHGLDACETARDISFCGHAILQKDILLIEDARQDLRFHDNPLVINAPFIRFYAGAPLWVDEQHCMGTLCLIDYQPRQLLAEDIADFKAFANLVIELLQSRMAMQPC